MINPVKSNLYKQSSKKYLITLLQIPNKDYLKQEYVAKQIHPYIATSPKPRLIEAPSESIKAIQRCIKKELDKIDVPNNVFSGVKGRSYIQNAEMHKSNKYIFKIDLTAFFPCITRDTVYAFFRDFMNTTPDIAEILTNFTTIDLALCNIDDLESIEKFLQMKGIKTPNHLISGSPTSQILSYLVNHKMFENIQNLCDKNGIVLSIYVDDITFSSSNKISFHFKELIYNIISKYLYKLSKSKVKYYTSGYPKLVTGAVIYNGKLIVRNSLRYKTINELNYYKSHPNDTKSLNRLRGLVIAARQSEPTKFQSIYNLVRKAST